MFISIIKDEYQKTIGVSSVLKAIQYYAFQNEFRVQCLIRRILLTKNRFIKQHRILKLERKYSVKVGTSISVGEKQIVHHSNGIVIGQGTIIGNNCEIYHQVTLGQKNNKYPVIRNNVTLYPGCKVIGGITIGDNAIIAPNSVVISNIPNNAVVSGIPAKIIKINKKET